MLHSIKMAFNPKGIKIMKGVNKKIAPLLMLFIVLISTDVYGQVFREFSLNGVDTIFVDANIYEDNVIGKNKKERLLKNLKDLIELELRRSDIVVGVSNTGATLSYDLTLVPVRIGGEIYGYALSFGLHFSRLVNYDTGKNFNPSSFGVTWYESGAFVIPVENLDSSLKEELDNLLMTFLIEHDSINQE